QEPVLRLLPISGLLDPCRRLAVLESLSLWRPPERCRSAVFDLCAAVRAVGADRPDAVAARVRSPGVCASPDRRACGSGDRLARHLAGAGDRAGGGGVHVRRCRCRTAAAYGPHYHLRAVSARAPVAAA